jgi:hypothetical protein
MSLINRMLRDLDSRKGRPGRDAVAGDLLRAVTPRSGGRRKPAIMLVIAALGISMATGAWLQRRTVVASSPMAVLAASAIQAAAPSAKATAASPSVVVSDHERRRRNGRRAAGVLAETIDSPSRPVGAPTPPGSSKRNISAKTEA